MHVNHLPYMPFPPNWPRYIPKDKVANWFEAYAESMELNFWTGTEFLGGTYDDKEGVWSVQVRNADGDTRELQPRHVVMATGVSGIPSLPDIPSLKDFSGQVLHSSEYDDAPAWADSNVIIIGHRQQRPRHRAGSALPWRPRHDDTAQPHHDPQGGAERATALRLV